MRILEQKTNLGKCVICTQQVSNDNEIWLKRSLTDKETLDDKTIICLYKYGYDTSTWYKIVIHDYRI